MAQSVGDLVVNLDVDAAKFKEQVGYVRKQLSGLGTAANDEGNKAAQAFSKQELAAKRAGLSVGQYSNAMRMLPPQFTDIATQLAGGQNPLLILLQQGGQVKDMFGGIVPAAKAVSTYIAGLVSPFTLAAGAVGLLTYAVYNNRKEIDAAATIVKSSLGVSGDAAQRLALNMVAISDKTGEAIDDVAKMFVTTSDGATETFNKLLSVGYSYDEAKQKVESYKTSSNFTALNADIDQHRREVLKISDAWTDAAIKVKNYYTAADKGKQSVALGGAIDPIVGVLEQAKDLQKTVNDLRIKGNLEVKKSVDWINKEYLAADRVAAAENRLKEAREQAGKISASGDVEAISTANKLITAREKEVEEAKKQANKKPKEKAYSEDAGQRLLDQINQQTAALQQQLSSSDKLTSATQARIKFEQMIADLKGKAQLTADQKSILANSDQLLNAYKMQETLTDQVKTVDEYRKMQTDLAGKEEKIRDATADRLNILEKMKEMGKISPEEYGQTSKQIVDSSITGLPKSVQRSMDKSGSQGGGLSGTLGGDFSQLSNLDQQRKDLEKWYSDNLASLESYRQQRADLNSQWDNEELKLRQQHALAEQNIEQQKNAIVTGAIQSGLGSMVDITKTAFGEKSAIYKATFIADKAYAIAQSTLAIQAGIAQAAANPFPYNLVAMASVAAATASIVSNIQSVALTGMAHSGLDSVPETGTWLLQKGERVTTAATSAKLDKTLDQVQQQKQEDRAAILAGGVSQKITVNGNPDDRTLLLIQNAAKQGADQAYQRITNNLASGQGKISKALGSGWSTGRRKR